MIKSKILLILRAIIRKDNKILLVQRSSNDSWEPNKWEFPGGKVDFGENLNETLKREIKEETGLDIVIKEPLFFWDGPTVKEKYKDLRHVTLFFKCSLLSNRKVRLSNEHKDFIWLKSNEIRNHRGKKTYPTIKVLDKLK